MKAKIKYFSVVDIESSNPEHSNNGGDYYFGRIIAVNVSANPPVPLAVRYWTGADFDYCPVCGRFEQWMGEHMERFHYTQSTVAMSEADGWENGCDVSHAWKDEWRNKEEFAVVKA